MSTSDPQPPFSEGSTSPTVNQPQYAPPVFTPGSPQPPQSPQYSAAVSSRTRPGSHDRANVLGIVALVLLVLQLIFGTFTPLLYRMTMNNYALLSTIITTVNVLILLAVVGLAIGGVMQRSANRFRWAAIGSLVAGALGIVGTILSLITNWITSALYW